MRKIICLNDGWTFYLDASGKVPAKKLEPEQFRPVCLPHDWSADYPPAKEEKTAGGGGYVRAGIGWYLRTLTVPCLTPDTVTELRFDGIYMDSTIYVNGQKAGGHGYGYTTFYTDITAFLHEGENQLLVRVDNSRIPNSRWYSGSGIYRDVWLETHDIVSFAPFGVRTATNGLYPDSDAAALQILADVKNQSTRPVIVGITHRLYDGEQLVSTSGISLSLKPGACSSAMVRPQITSPHLWSDEDPYLYTLVSTLTLDGTAVDQVEHRIGIRTAVFDADQGFLLNGKSVKIRGMCLHHDCGMTGAAGYREMWERRLRLLKDMGCNGIRCSHNPPFPFLLDLADELGFLVMDEAFDEWLLAKNKTDNYYSEELAYGSSMFFASSAEEDLTAMIRRDYNHPSVVIWSIGNEIPEQSSIEGVRLLKDLQDICHREDTSRMVTSACDNIAAIDAIRTLPAFEEALDVVGYNYAGRWRERAETFYEQDRETYPHRRFIGTENPSAGGIRGDYSGNGRHGGYANVTMSHEALWRFTASHPYVSGDFLWTGIDYLGECRWPNRGAACGPIDTAGFPKDTYYYFRSIWNSKDVTLHLAPAWNFPGEEGVYKQVVCYTNLEEVRLYINGRYVGSRGYECPRFGCTKTWMDTWEKSGRITTNDLHLSWDVAYEPGVLRAEGYRNGALVCVTEQVTPGSLAALQVTAWRESVKAGELLQLDLEARDAESRFIASACPMITAEVEGEAELVGMDGGDLTDLSLYAAPSRRMFNGRLLAVVRTKRPGSVTIRFRTDTGLTVTKTYEVQ